jgi:ribosomal protein S18 acetylase RimI-like enzyme
MWLLQTYHGQGIGYRLILELLAFARQHGYQTAYLTTSLQQQQAIAFYKRVGFRQVPARTGDIEAYGVAMELTL